MDTYRQKQKQNSSNWYDISEKYWGTELSEIFREVTSRIINKIKTDIPITVQWCEENRKNKDNEKGITIKI